MLPLKTEENNQLYFDHILVDSVPDQKVLKIGCL